MSFDLVIKGGTLVIPFTGEVKADIGVIDGKIAAIGADLQGGKKVVDATGKYVAPGAVDAHFHIGIYRPIAQDAFEETRSSLVVERPRLSLTSVLVSTISIRPAPMPTSSRRCSMR